MSVKFEEWVAGKLWHNFLLDYATTSKGGRIGVYSDARVIRVIFNRDVFDTLDVTKEKIPTLEDVLRLFPDLNKRYKFFFSSIVIDGVGEFQHTINAVDFKFSYKNYPIKIPEKIYLTNIKLNNEKYYLAIDDKGFFYHYYGWKICISLERINSVSTLKRLLHEGTIFAMDSLKSIGVEIIDKTKN